MNVYAGIMTLLFFGAAFLFFRQWRKNPDAKIAKLKKELDLKSNTINDQMNLIEKKEKQINEIKKVTHCNDVNDLPAFIDRLRKRVKKYKDNK